MMYSELLHDLRMPLQLIYSCAQIIEMEIEHSEPGLSQYVDMLMENVSHMQRMLTNFLDSESIAENAMKANLSRVDINACVRDVCSRCKQYASELGITLTYRTNVVSLSMGIDLEKITRIMFNLISNALKHTPAGGNVSVETETMGDFVEVRVQDRGVGIAPNMLPKVFERGVTSSGHGLGLYISRSFARLHGGDIMVETQTDVGSLFTLRLPIREFHAEAVERVNPGIAEGNMRMEMCALSELAVEGKRDMVV